MKLKTLAVAVAAATISSSAFALDFHGYMRAGIATNVDGGSQVCYGTGGGTAHMVGRLGDECDMYTELALSQDVYEKDGKAFKVATNIAYGTYESLNGIQYNSQGNSWQGQGGDNSSPWDGGRMSVREAYAQATNIWGDSTLWVGKRFGQRKDVHIMDLFYLMNSGYGAGFDGLTLGNGKFSFQWTQASNGGNDQVLENPDYPSAVPDAATGSYETMHKLDARYSFPIGSQNLEVIGIYGTQSLTDSQKDAGSFDKDSFMGMVELTSTVLGGFNKLSFTYGTNALALGASIDNFGGLNNANWFGEGDGYRVLDHGVIKMGKKWDLGYAAMYSQANPDAENGNSWFEGSMYSVVIRPVYKWNEIMSTMVEAGYHATDWKNEWRNGTDPGNPGGNWDNGDLAKVTVAQAWSPLMNGGFWARPSFRVYGSYYTGERVAEKGDTMFGAQVEAWW